MKVCSKCGIEKYNMDFSKNGTKGLRSQCKDCHNEYLREYYKRNKESARSRNLLKRYGITEAQYKQMIKDQDFECAICHDNWLDYEGPNWPVDHCHRTGRTRAILCWKCNLIIGHANDNVELLQTAIDYILKWGD